MVRAAQASPDHGFCGVRARAQGAVRAGAAPRLVRVV